MKKLNMLMLFSGLIASAQPVLAADYEPDSEVRQAAISASRLPRLQTTLGKVGGTAIGVSLGFGGGCQASAVVLSKKPATIVNHWTCGADGYQNHFDAPQKMATGDVFSNRRALNNLFKKSVNTRGVHSITHDGILFEFLVFGDMRQTTAVKDGKLIYFAQ